ncbi:MAG: LPS assembly lipoprotein LptE [Bacteroidales bacterium]
MKQIALIILSLIFVTACSISYKFNGASIDYTKTKTITIIDFPIKTAMVYAPLAIAFNEGLKDTYLRQTRLTQARQNGDLQIEGSINRYDLTPQAVKEDAFSSRTRLTIGVSVKFTNNVDPKQNFERSFSAYREYESNQLLTGSLQDQLIKEIVEELTDQIYIATVANW